GILTKRANKFSAITSGMLGLGTCLLLYFFWGPKHAPQAGTIGMLVSLIIPALILPFTPAKNKELLEPKEKL
ncbi:hypothetical protein DRQ33_07875, partial [bacterium]